MKKIDVYLWEEKTVQLKNIKRQGDKRYDPRFVLENAKNISRLLIETVPGNALDIIIDRIAEEIKPMLDNPVKIEMLKEHYDIQNRITIALTRLSEIGNREDEY